MKKLIDKIDETASCGSFGIPTKIIKYTSSFLAPFLTKLFNDCIDKSVFIDELKIAIVTPLFKKKAQ